MARFRRKSRGYNGSEVTSHQLKDLLPQFLKEIGDRQGERGDLVLAAWPQLIGSVIGPQFACMTQAVTFNEGILTVKVKNSTLYSMLAQHEKPRILKILKEQFPTTTIQSIQFRIG